MNKAFQFQVERATVKLPMRFYLPKFRTLASGAAAIAVVLLLWLLVAWGIGSYKVLSDDPTVWQSSIDKLNEDTSIAFPNLDDTAPVLFVGSSSIRLFKGLENIFPNEHVIKKGFGGAKIKDIAHYKSDLILQHQPRVVVFYIGINDLLYSDYENVDDVSIKLFEFLSDMQLEQPDTQWVLLAQRPMEHSDYNPVIKAYNHALRQYASTHLQVHYVDINQSLMNNNRLNARFMHWDGLHLSEEGYLAWGNAMYDQLHKMELVN